jgi:hypothetical protein
MIPLLAQGASAAGGEALVKAASNEPALYILVVLVMFVVWEVRKELKEGRLERRTTSESLVSTITEVMDRNEEASNRCHTAQAVMANQFAENRMASEQRVTDAIVRCSAAVEAGQRTNERAVMALDNNSQVITQVMGLLRLTVEKHDGPA